MVDRVAKTFRLLSGYTLRVFMRKPNRNSACEPTLDLRDIPTYTIPEAALFLGIPQRTLSGWYSSRNGMLRASGSGTKGRLLSFNDLVETYSIFLLRSHHRLTMQAIRKGRIDVRSSAVDIFGNRVRRNSEGKIVTMFPWRFWENDRDSKPVQLDSEVMSGRLVLTGTRIPVRIILGRHLSGQSSAQIAGDYGLPVVSVETALRHVYQPCTARPS